MVLSQVHFFSIQFPASRYSTYPFGHCSCTSNQNTTQPNEIVAPSALRSITITRFFALTFPTTFSSFFFSSRFLSRSLSRNLAQEGRSQSNIQLCNFRTNEWHFHPNLVTPFHPRLGQPKPTSQVSPQCSPNSAECCSHRRSGGHVPPSLPSSHAKT